MPISAITTHPYAECLAYQGNHVGFGGKEPIPNEPGSLQNFTRIANGLNAPDSQTCANPINYSFWFFLVYDGLSSNPAQWK